MLTRTKTLAASLFLGAAIIMTPVSSVAAANNVAQDGLVNLAVGDVNVLNNSPITVVAEVAAQICGVNVSDVAVLATLVDTSGKKETVCKSAQGPVTIRNK